jgi:hypothetical protein
VLKTPCIPGRFNVDDMLCMEDERKAGTDYIIRFHARLFQILPGTKVKLRPGNTSAVRTKLDNSIEIIWKDKTLLVKEAVTLFDEYTYVQKKCPIPTCHFYCSPKHN